MDDLRFLNRLVQDIEPDVQQTEAARRSLLDHIDASQTRDQLLELIDSVPDDTITVPPWNTQYPRSATRSALMRIAVAASVLAVAAVAVVGVLNSPAADATLDRLARAVEILPNESFTGVAVERHTHAETLVIEPVDVTDPDHGLVGVIVITEEIRRQAPSGIIQIETTITDATFITPIDGATQSAVEMRIGVGTTETITAVLPDNLGVDRQLLSSDAQTVYQHLVTSITTDGDTSTPVSTQILDEIIALHTTFILTPSERAVTIEVLAMVDDVTVETSTAAVTVTSEYITETGQEQLTAGFNQSGWLILQSLTFLDGVPKLTTDPVPVYAAQLTPPEASR
jgi:hypothetical protein